MRQSPQSIGSRSAPKRGGHREATGEACWQFDSTKTGLYARRWQHREAAISWLWLNTPSKRFVFLISPNSACACLRRAYHSPVWGIEATDGTTSFQLYAQFVDLKWVVSANGMVRPCSRPTSE